MGSLTLTEQGRAATMGTHMLQLLQLDDLWTASVSKPEGSQSEGERPGPGELTTLVRRMTEGLERMEEYVSLLGEIGERLGEDGEDRLNSLLWGSVLSGEDRDDLRWLTARHGGFQGMVRVAADAVSGYRSEIDLLNGQTERLEQGVPATGDLTRKFRCGLGKAVIVSGIGSLPTTAVTATATGVMVGTGAAVLVGATGGIASIALVVAALFFIRKSSC